MESNGAKGPMKPSAITYHKTQNTNSSPCPEGTGLRTPMDSFEVLFEFRLDSRFALKQWISEVMVENPFGGMDAKI